MGDVVNFHHEGEVLVAGEKSDQELIEAGKVLAGKQAITNREIGEWFNYVKGSRGGDRKSKNQIADSATRFSVKEICERAGMSYSFASACGRVVDLFPTVASQGGLTWSACVELLPAHAFWKENVGEKKAAEYMKRLISDAAAGKPFMSDFDADYKYRGPWTVVDARRQVAFIVGKQVQVTHKQADTSKKVIIGAVEKAVADLPKRKADTIVKAVTSEVKRETEKLQSVFSDAVNEKATRIALDKTETMRQVLDELKQKAELDAKLAANRLKGAPALMTKAEFKLVLNCLHPDRAPADRREKFAEAFAIIKRLEEGTRWDS